MSSQRHPSFFRSFWLSLFLTIILGGVVAWYGGADFLWIFLILVILEVTFSFDNSVINSQVLRRFSPFWRMLFLTVGIVIAVFIVRFLLPIAIVMIVAGRDFIDVINLALHQPESYAALIEKSAGTINAFGGMFLLLVGLSYFMDRNKDIHWLHSIESRLASAGKYRFLTIIVALAVAATVIFTIPEQYDLPILFASLCGIALHTILTGADHLLGKRGNQTGIRTGWAAFVAFCYLEVLDASFSLDGVIGALAITSNVFLIIAGLGAGAIWMRSLTVYLLHKGTVQKYQYLEHGAHWAILALGIVMLVKLYGLEPPDWMTGSLGLVFVTTAVFSSIIEKRRQATTEQTSSLLPKNQA